jgi:hypothetical protein
VIPGVVVAHDRMHTPGNIKPSLFVTADYDFGAGKVKQRAMQNFLNEDFLHEFEFEITEEGLNNPFK